MASEFVYVLAAGLTVLVVGGVLAGFADSSVSQGDGVDADADAPVMSASLGTIGTIEATSRTVQFGDVTVQARSRTSEVASRDTVTVGSNVFGASTERLTFEAEQDGKAHIAFTPSSATSPENLVVTVNGERVQVPDFTTGEEVTITVSIPAGENTVAFSAERPGSRVWRTPSYTREGVAVDVTAPRLVRPFRAYDYEIRGFDRGELRFSLTEDVIRDEPLEIQMNGNTVFSQTPVKRALPYTTTFFSNTTGLSAGENVLSISTGGRSSYPLDNLQVTLYFFAGTQQRTVVKEFDLRPAEYRKLGADNGRLTLTVDRVTLRRPVTVQLPNATFTRTLDAGENTFTFGQQAVTEGPNQVTVATDGSYRIPEMTVSVQDE